LKSGKTRNVSYLWCAVKITLNKNLITARHFITRALLTAENFAQAQQILRDNGVGAADGCSINMTFLKWVGVV
jgi:hypothetical protein